MSFQTENSHHNDNQESPPNKKQQKETLNEVFSDIKDMMKMSPSHQQLSISPKLLPAKEQEQKAEINQLSSQIRDLSSQGTQPDFEKSSPNIIIQNSNNKNNNSISQQQNVSKNSIFIPPSKISNNKGQNEMREILLEKEAQNQKVRDINNQLKEKIQKLSQALDISLVNQKQFQEKLQVSAQENAQPKPTPQREIMQKNLKLKEKEIQAYTTIIASLKKQNEQLKYKLENKEGMGRVLDLEDKLKESERQKVELQKEVKSMSRIQQDQAKALEKLANEGDFPNKIKHLMEELKLAKEKIRELEEKSKRDDKNALQIQDYLIKLEEQNRDLKNKLKNKFVGANYSMIINDQEQTPNNKAPPNDNQQQQKQTQSMNQNGVAAFSENPQIEELQRFNAILMKAKEVQYKKGQYLKMKFEKKQAKFNATIEQLNCKIAEQDKPLKAGFNQKINSRLNNLSIDVNASDLKSNNPILAPIQNGEITTSRKTNQLVSIGVKSTQNRSKSIDPTAKRLVKMPQTTKKTKMALNQYNKEEVSLDNSNIQEIEVNNSEIRLSKPQSIIMSPNEYEKVDEITERKIRDLEQETDDLLARFQAQNETYNNESNNIVETSLNYDAFEKLEGDISKLNDDIIDEDINHLMNEYQ